MSNHTIYFDMDGTIADLYAVENWQAKLEDGEVSPYSEAAPMVNMFELNRLLAAAARMGYRLGVISWLSKEATQDYKKAIRKAKKQWLENYLDVIFDEIHLVKYGARKDQIAKDKKGILFDDDEQVRKNWKGIAINPEEINIIDFLKFLVRDE